MILRLIDWLILLAAIWIAWLLGRRGRGLTTWRGYFLASGKVGAGGVAATYVGANLTFTAIFLILSAEAYKRGLVVLCVPVFWIVGTFFFLWIYPNLADAMAKGLTLHGFVGERYNSSAVQKLASVWTLAAFVGTVALEFYGGIRLLKWAGLPLFANLSLALLFALLTMAFTVTGGFRGVVFADIWMDVLMLGATGALAYYVISRPLPLAAAPVAASSPASFDLAFVVGMGIIFVPFQLCLLDSWQRCSAWTKRDHSPKTWLLPGAAMLALAYSVPVLIGYQVRRAGLVLDGGRHPLEAYLNTIHLPAGVIGLVVAGFFCAVVSTADELLNCCGLTVIFDLLRTPLHKEDRTELEEARIISSGKFYTIVFGMISALAALLCLYFERSISDLAVAVFSSQVAFSLPILVAAIWPKKARGWGTAAVAGVLAAFMAGVGLVVAGWLQHDQDMVDGAPLGSLLAAVLFFSVTVAAIYLQGKSDA
jgi:sodium/pantothenate symporter